MFMLEKALHLEREAVSFVMVLNSCGSSFYNLGLAPKEALSYAPMRPFTLLVECSIVPEEQSY